MLTVHEIAAAVRGQLVGDATDQRPVASVVVDSRQVTLGALFVALRGQKHDGHDFVFDAFVKGARAAIVERVPERVSAFDKANAFPMVVVGDGLAALQGLAQYWRRKLALTVVAVTGSVGKTTTREVVSGVLEQRYRVLRSEGNLNTEIGVP
ncbi:MAG TPA: Mur ligase domain-containing protein, partial [Chloroflexota bacterium]|nr:Mur ligase domain-containing protein [Chloroflexota bacterium]